MDRLHVDDAKTTATEVLMVTDIQSTPPNKVLNFSEFAKCYSILFYSIRPLPRCMG